MAGSVAVARPTYYDRLHVHAEAPQAVIRASYRALMQQLKAHPDLGGDHDLAAAINEAYATLRDPERRARYDASLQPSASAPRRRGASARRAPSEQPPRQAPKPSGTALVVAPHQCPFCAARIAARHAIDEHSQCLNCASPLSRPAEGRQAGSQRRRAFERQHKHMPVTFYLSWPGAANTGTSLDLSLSGMLLDVPSPLVSGQLIKLESAVCSAIGRVAHCRPAAATFRCGIAFVTLRFEQPRGTFVTERA